MPEREEFALLRTFRELFEGTQYKHRDSSLGDLVASQLYEDLVALNRSPKLTARVQAHECVVNLANRAIGRPSRRGDGTFGELVPTAIAVTEAGLLVARGEVANIEIGINSSTGSSAALTVTGVGSSVSQISTAPLTVGSAGPGATNGTLIQIGRAHV